MCGEIKSLDLTCMGHDVAYSRYASGAFETCLFNQETGEVFDKNNNLIGHGTPIVKDFKTVALNVTLIQK